MKKLFTLKDVGLVLFLLFFLTLPIQMLFYKGTHFNEGKEVKNEAKTETQVVMVTPESKFDTSALEEWCGEPTGTIRMLGAWIDEDGNLEDETGNLWAWGGTIPNCGFCLVWIDDMNTPDIVQDDEIVKLWVEFNDWA